MRSPVGSVLSGLAALLLWSIPIRVDGAESVPPASSATAVPAQGPLPALDFAAVRKAFQRLGGRALDDDEIRITYVRPIYVRSPVVVYLIDGQLRMPAADENWRGMCKLVSFREGSTDYRLETLSNGRPSEIAIVNGGLRLTYALANEIIDVRVDPDTGAMTKEWKQP